MSAAYAFGMKILFNAVTVKNLLICVGIYYISRWVTVPIAIAFGKLTQGIIYSGEFEGAVVMPLILHLPAALVAAGAGGSVFCLVDSSRPLRWVLFTALIYACFGFLGYHWSHPSWLHDRLFQVVGALFPVITCLLGGIMAGRRRAAARAAQVSTG